MQTFATENLSKCEVLLISFSKPTSQVPLSTLDNPARTYFQRSHKCLSYWRSWDLSAIKAVDKAIKRARRAKNIGCLSWEIESPVREDSFRYLRCLNPPLWYIVRAGLFSEWLEVFQGMISRRNQSVTPHWPHEYFPKMVICCQECQSYEERLHCHGLTNDVVGAVVSARQVKMKILRAHWEACLNAASQHQSTMVATRMSNCVSWPNQWDMALDHGEHGMSQ